MTIKTRKHKITKSEDIAKIIRAILDSESICDRDKEHFWVIGLDTKCNISFIELVSLGILSSSIVHPRETFRLAIMKAVNSIMICHNHPSGDITPSEDDVTITKRLREAGQILGIAVLDHVIIGCAAHYSFHDMEEL